MSRPLSPQEAAYLQQLQQRALASGQVRQGPQSGVGVPGPGMQASLYPPDRVEQSLIAGPGGLIYMDLSIPTPKVPVSDRIGLNLNDRSLSFTGLVANTPVIQRLGFDTPAYAYALTADVRDTTGADFPVGANPSSLFRIQFSRTNGVLFQTTPVMGSLICGTAQRPRWLSGPAWEFTQGSVLVCTVTPLVANLEVDVAIWCMEIIGPTNIE